MGNKKRLSDLECATAQAVLNKKNIKKIRPAELQKLLQVTSIQRASMILRRIGWRRTTKRCVGTTWYKDNADKVFSYQQSRLIKLRALKLGVVL